MLRTGLNTRGDMSGDGSEANPYAGDEAITAFLVDRGLRNPSSVDQDTLSGLLKRGFQSDFDRIHLKLGDITHTVEPRYTQSGTKEDPLLDFPTDSVDKIVAHQRRLHDGVAEVFFRNSAGVLYRAHAEGGDVRSRWEVEQVSA